MQMMAGKVGESCVCTSDENLDFVNAVTYIPSYHVRDISEMGIRMAIELNGPSGQNSTWYGKKALHYWMSMIQSPLNSRKGPRG